MRLLFKVVLVPFLIFFISTGMNGQDMDTTKYKVLDFTGDFRFRIEQDWKGTNPNGSAIADRSRLRYRFRFGLEYTLDKYSAFGARIRSGNLNDQQGPHVTLGGGNGEFELVPVGLEKLYYKLQLDNCTFWIGKNTVPLIKMNELFWNDNVYPEGIGFLYHQDYAANNLIKSLDVNAGHFIIRSNNSAFSEDSYFQMLQLGVGAWDGRMLFFPAIYHFNAIGNYPDRQETFRLDYTLLHLATKLRLGANKQISVGLEYFNNFQDYQMLDSISQNMQSQKNGWVINATYGKLIRKGDWQVSLTYAHLERFAIVDYFAQNDWTRWDYSFAGATGSRLSNFKGWELCIIYKIKENFDLNLRSYFVEQIEALGLLPEKGNRIRLDLNIGF